MKVLTLVISAILLLSFMSTGAAFAHYPHTTDECATTEELGTREECIIEQRYSGKEVKFVDMYFSEDVDADITAGDLPTKIEVAPGDGTTILAAIMSNSGAFELTGMKGWLSLPMGFEAVGKPSGEPAFDTYDLGIAAGDTFVFEFPVKVKENTHVGTYNALLHVEFFRATDIGLDVRDFNIEFFLPGKSIIDAVAVDSVLLPSTRNKAMIEIINGGSAPASGVIVTAGSSGESASVIETEATAQELNQIVNVGQKVFDLGVIRPYSKLVIDPILYVNPALADTRQILVVDILYFDSYGERKKMGVPINFLVAGSTTANIDFSVTTDKDIIHTITETPFTVTLENTGTEAAKSIEVTVNTPLTATVALEQEVPEASRSPVSILGGDGYRRINSIEPGESADVTVTIFASEEAVNTAFQLPITISYLDELGGLKQIQRQVSVYVQGTINLRIYDLGITYIADQANVSGYLLNEGTNLALFTTVELVGDQTDGIRAVGGSQYLGDLTANSPLPFNIPVRFAEGTSEESYPVTIKVSYKDDLRIPFEVEVDGNVPYVSPVVEKKDGADGIYSSLGILTGIGVAVAGGYYYFMRVKKRKISILGREGKSVVDSAADEDDDDLDFLSESKDEQANK